MEAFAAKICSQDTCLSVALKLIFVRPLKPVFLKHLKPIFLSMLQHHMRDASLLCCFHAQAAQLFHLQLFFILAQWQRWIAKEHCALCVLKALWRVVGWAHIQACFHMHVRLRVCILARWVDAGVTVRHLTSFLCCLFCALAEMLHSHVC